MRTKTWNELCLRNKEPWSQYIAYNSTSQGLFDHQKYLKEAFELSKRDKYNLQLLKMWPCPINLLTFMFLEKTNVHPFFQKGLITQLDVKLLTRFFVQMCFQSNYLLGIFLFLQIFNWKFYSGDPLKLQNHVINRILKSMQIMLYDNLPFVKNTLLVYLVI